LNYDGIMTEVHTRPDDAWSDAKQQITPFQFKELVERLVVRKPNTDDKNFLETLDHCRHEIDEIDEELMNLLGARMKLSDSIGEYKKRNNIAILQSNRWNAILEKAIAQGTALGLSEEFVSVFLKAIHQESINHQAKVMNEEKVGIDN